ncbi:MULTISPECIES: hypothetical protein [unclassified Microbacterium]|uniref:hypothetical protein n=1 Tax=unclassified Microbacterium TaxID=2609290 RepID=UPI003744C98B
MSGLTDAIGRAVLDDAEVEASDPLQVADHLALVAASARAEAEARALLQRSVVAARAGGASWARIGEELGMSRQAAQQRFGAVEDDGGLGGAERWLGPVTAYTEMAELELAGRAGWRTVEAGMLSHRVVLTDTQWEHRRILWRTSLAAESADGWAVGCRAFPWIYLVRDRGVPPEQP